MAKKLFKEACDMGDDLACFKLGYFHLEQAL